jgi:hypothetical protein
MLGATVRGWKLGLGIDFPVEEPLLWLSAPFCCVFFYDWWRPAWNPAIRRRCAGRKRVL